MINRWGVEAITAGKYREGIVTRHWFRWSAKDLAEALNHSAKCAKQDIVYYVVRLK